MKLMRQGDWIELKGCALEEVSDMGFTVVPGTGPVRISCNALL
jgi:hypothetical protein